MRNFEFRWPSSLKPLPFFLRNSRALHRPVSSIPGQDVAGQLASEEWNFLANKKEELVYFETG